MCLPRGGEAPSQSQKSQKKRINACALVTKRLLRLLSPQEKPMKKTTFTPFVPQKNRMKRTTFTSFVLIRYVVNEHRLRNVHAKYLKRFRLNQQHVISLLHYFR